MLLVVRTLLTTLAVIAGLLAPAAGADATGRHIDHLRNGLIAYTNVVDGHSQLFTVRPDGSHIRQLTFVTEGDVFSPDWSPDGSRIVFGYEAETEGGIGMVDADGSDLRLRTRSDVILGRPSFAPDGRHLFVELWDLAQVDAIFRTNLDGSHERQVTFPTPGVFYDTNPEVSPDGRTVSFVRITIADETQSALFTVDLRSGRERQLTPFSEDVAIKQAWSPDGRRLTYTRAGYQHLPGISSNVVTIRRNGSGAHQVTSLTGGDSNAFTGSYSPDGQWIVYRLETPTSASLVKVHPWGGEPVTIFDIDGVRPRFIDWGPAPR